MRNIRRKRLRKKKPAGLLSPVTVARKIIRPSQPIYPTSSVYRANPYRKPAATVVSGSIFPKTAKPQRKVSGAPFRIALPLSACRMRKAYKKTMLKSLAAQISRKSGGNGLKRWRKVRRAATPKIRFNC